MTDSTINADVTMGGATGMLLVGRYRIVKQLGQGGMGSVWLAEDVQLDNRPVAIKMLPSVLVSNKRAYQQLKSEALVSLKLTHPNIATVRAFEENNGNPFLVVDYIDGVTLDEYLADHCVATASSPASGGGIPESEVVRLLTPIAAALDYAHAKGVIHRDVKPGNVMIAKDGTPYILDFGIAREIQETMTRVTGRLSSGTLLYMSPEQLHGAAPTPAQDVYSFAAMAYECLTGHPPFARGQIEYQIEHDTPTPLDPHIAISGSVMAGLAKRIEDRPKNCAAVLAAAGTCRTAGTASDGRARVSRGPHFIRMAIVLVLAIVISVGVVLGWAAYEDRQDRLRAAAKAEQRRIAELRKLAEAASDRTEKAWLAAERERYGELSGLKAKAGELVRLREKGRAAMRSEDWIAATNCFHLAMACSCWLASNSVQRTLCVKAMSAAETARMEAEKCEARMLARVAYERAVECVKSGSGQMEASNFDLSALSFRKAEKEFASAGNEAKKILDRNEANRVSEKVARKKKAFDACQFSAIVNDPESETIPELRFLLGRLYHEGIGVDMDLKRAVSLYGGVTGVCALAECVLMRMRLSGDFLERDQSSTITNRIVACIPRVKELAEAGDSFAMMALHEIYDEGIGTAKDEALGRKWLHRAAEAGNVLARCGLAECLCYGTGGENMDMDRAVAIIKDLSRMQIWHADLVLGYLHSKRGDKDAAVSCFRQCLLALRRGAEQGRASMQAGLGQCYEEGWGVLEDHDEAVRWFRRAADKGNSGAKAHLAVAHIAGKGVEKDEREAFRLAKESAEDGDCFGQDILGILLENGIGTSTNKVEAFRWFKCAAEQGQQEAMVFLANKYRYGSGCESNAVEALGWMRKAADRGHVEAQNYLGIMLTDGEGASDSVQAAQWFRKAADQGLAIAQRNLGECYLAGNGVEKNPYVAIGLFRKAAEQGQVEAQNTLGLMLENGNGCKKDVGGAAKWYAKAAEKGFPAAQFNLGICYYEGRGVMRDRVRAVGLFRKAALQGQANAQNMLGYMLEAGEGCVKDVEQAVDWYRRSSEQGFATAQWNLGLCYLEGKGVMRNRTRAIALIRKAANQGHADARKQLVEMQKESR